jgi:hypothetical protein
MGTKLPFRENVVTGVLGDFQFLITTIQVQLVSQQRRHAEWAVLWLYGYEMKLKSPTLNEETM